MTQSKSRRLLYQQARLIRIQWAIIMALVCTIVLTSVLTCSSRASCSPGATQQFNSQEVKHFGDYV